MPGPSELQAVLILLRAILMRCSSRLGPTVRREVVEWGLGHRCSTDSPSTPPGSSSVLRAGQLVPCIAVPAALRTPPRLYLSQTRVDTLWGCGGRCDSKCDPGQFSMIAELLSHFADVARQYVRVCDLIMEHQPDSQSIQQSNRLRRPHRRPSV